MCHLLQGYVDAAEVFHKESNTKPGVDLAAITDRMEIRKAVQSGDIQQAIERVNDLNPEVRSILEDMYLCHITHLCIFMRQAAAMLAMGDPDFQTWTCQQNRAIRYCCLQILEQQHELSFHMQQQRLIELIRQGRTEEALEHAQEYLAPPGEDDPAFLEELGNLFC